MVSGFMRLRCALSAQRRMDPFKRRERIRLEKISPSTVRYMMEGIRDTCRAFRRRRAGSDSERACQRYFAGELRAWSDRVDEEPFHFHPHAFMGWILMASLLGIASVALFWARFAVGSATLSLASFALISLSAAMGLFEFVLYRPFIDFLFPRAVSRNILAYRNPTGEIRRRIVFCGHADAAYELRYALSRWKGTARIVLAGSAAGILLIFLTSAARFIDTLLGSGAAAAGLWRFAGILQAAHIPFLIAALFFINWRCVVDGANDNLSGCFVAMSVLKEMAERGFRFAHTQVCCLITGAEESGLRGALACAKKHLAEFSRCETVFIVLDTLREADQLQLYLRGQNGLCKNSRAVGALLARAGRECGVALPEAKPYPGATDAEAFSRYGLASCGLCGVSHTPPPYYHTRYDTGDNVSAECLRLSLEICVRAAALYDSEGLPRFDAPAVRAHVPSAEENRSAAK